MTGSISPSIPSLNTANSTEDPNVRSSIITLRDSLNAVLTSGNQLDGAQIGAGTLGNAAAPANTWGLDRLANQTAGRLLVSNSSGVIVAAAPDVDFTVSTAGVLSSAHRGVYKSLFSAQSFLSAQAVAGTYLVGGITGPGQSASNNTSYVSGFSVNMASSSNVQPPPLFSIVAADYAVTGLTTKLRLRTIVMTNATAPLAAGQTFTFGLYPVTVAGTANTIAYTLGTVVSGSQATYTAPPASTVFPGFGSDFAISAAPDGVYALGCVTSAALQANAACSLHATLQVHHTT